MSFVSKRLLKSFFEPLTIHWVFPQGGDFGDKREISLAMAGGDDDAVAQFDLVPFRVAH